MKHFLSISSLVLFALLSLLVSCGKSSEPEKPSEIAVTSVNITQASAELKVGETVQLTATVQPNNATNKTITWTSSNQSVATISNGLVTAVGEGKSTITASAGGKNATCTVTVTKKTVSVTEVTLDKTLLEMVEGGDYTLIATVKPDDATDKTVTWTSSAESIATVQGGKVTAVKEGEATINAKSGEKSATCKVTVSKKVIPVESIELNKNNLSLIKGESETLVATVKPNDATDKTVSWSTSNSTIVTVDQSGKVIAINGGTAEITAKAGEHSAKCTIAVTVPVASVSLNLNEASLEEGQKITLIATVNPDDASDKTITWTSSASNIASVQNGEVTAINSGQAIITAKAGEKSASCTISVLKKKHFIKYKTADNNMVEVVSFYQSLVQGHYKEDNSDWFIVVLKDATTEVEPVLRETSITEVFISDGFDAIYNTAFMNCSELKSVVISSGIKSIGDNAFYNCRNLESINIPYGVESIGNQAFRCNSITKIELPNTVSSIGEEAFSYCTKLSVISLPSTMNSIGAGAFKFTNISSIDIPSGISTIENDLFQRSKLIKVTIPNGITSIGSTAFYECYELQEIIIPNSVISIRSHAFGQCEKLSSITLPNNIETIGDALFQGCTSLKNITIPNKIEIINAGAFSGCTNLVTVSLPASLKQIKYDAFSGCNKLSEIVIPKNVTSIGAGALFNCSGLQRIVLRPVIPPALEQVPNEITFFGSSCPIYVPGTSVNAYKQAEIWKNYSSRIQAAAD